jgi:hypothetical protein
LISEDAAPETSEERSLEMAIQDEFGGVSWSLRSTTIHGDSEMDIKDVRGTTHPSAKSQ